MEIKGWRSYQHAAIPSTAPHEPVNTIPIKVGSIWRLDREIILLARWASDWDCKIETDWWYVIKDSPFDISTLKSKRRYEINKGNTNFDVREINSKDFAEDFYQITVAAYSKYPDSYRPNIDHDSFIEYIGNCEDYKQYGAFSREDCSLCGYARLERNGNYIDFTVLKTYPNKEKLAINAAIVFKILSDHEDFFKSGGYICDGSRSIQHETAFQDYLEKYFQFRKAYCRLNIIYRPGFKWVINILFPFRGLIKRIRFIGGIHKIQALLKMEEFAKKCR